jgi:uncharacterized membrane protein
MPAAEHSVVIRTSAHEVFVVVADGTTAPRWRSGVLDVSRVSGDGLGAVYRQGVKGPGGRRIAADYEITAFELDRRIGFKAIAGPVRPVGEYRFSSTPEGTLVTMTLRAEVSGLKGLLMGRAVQRTMDAEVHALDRLKAVLEAEGR